MAPRAKNDGSLPPLPLESAEAITAGKQGKNQQDNSLLDKARHVYGVAAGMGGTGYGEVASLTALMAVQVSFLDGDGAKHGVPNQMRCAIQAANRLVLAAANGDVKVDWLKGAKSKTFKPGEMATTLCVLAYDWNAGKMVIGNVGDARCYVWRASTLTQVTDDHRRQPSRMIGMQPNIKIDLFRTDAVPGDLYLLCTDGLHRSVTDAQIAQVLRGYPGKNVAALSRELVKVADESKGLHNATAVLVKIPATLRRW